MEAPPFLSCCVVLLAGVQKRVANCTVGVAITEKYAHWPPVFWWALKGPSDMIFMLWWALKGPSEMIFMLYISTAPNDASTDISTH